jgi:hypothetical protein
MTSLSLQCTPHAHQHTHYRLRQVADVSVIVLAFDSHCNFKYIRSPVLKPSFHSRTQTTRATISLRNVSGGGALLPGLRERLEGGLAQLAPPASRLKVVSPANSTERRFAVWIGVLPSVGLLTENPGGGGVHKCCWVTGF